MRRHQVITVVGMGLYVLSLPLPAIVVGGHDLLGHSKHSDVMYGYQCLVAGFVVLPGWLANPFVLIGAPMLAAGMRRAALVLLSLALASAVIAPFLLMGFDMARLERLQIGYAVWLASVVTLLVGAITAPVTSARVMTRRQGVRGWSPQVSRRD